MRAQYIVFSRPTAISWLVQRTNDWYIKNFFKYFFNLILINVVFDFSSDVNVWVVDCLSSCWEMRTPRWSVFLCPNDQYGLAGEGGGWTRVMGWRDTRPDGFNHPLTPVFATTWDITQGDFRGGSFANFELSNSTTLLLLGLCLILLLRDIPVKMIINFQLNLIQTECFRFTFIKKKHVINN